MTCGHSMYHQEIGLGLEDYPHPNKWESILVIIDIQAADTGLQWG